MTEWTVEMRARLENLWAEGLSMSQIGDRLGVSKNSISGMAHRMGLPARPSPIKPSATPRAPRPQRVGRAPTLPPIASAPAVDIPPAPVARPHDGCSYIVDETRLAVRYCDAPVLVTGDRRMSYCPDHYARCYTPVPRRARALEVAQ